MGRSEKGRERRKRQKNSRKSKNKKSAKSLLKLAREENVDLNKKIDGLLKAPESALSLMSKRSVSRKDALFAILPSHATLSSDVVIEKDRKLGEGTFGIVSMGYIKSLDSFCAIKEGKNSRYFNATFEARVLQSLAGCEYFPYAFGVFDKKLVMELVTNEDRVVTVSSLQKEKKLTSAEWESICLRLSSAVKYMHLKNLLHNDLKSNNVLLKLRDNVWIPKLADMGKVTLKTNPETYNLSEAQRERYNKLYPHLAYELRNVYGSKTTFSSDIYSLGYIFKHLEPTSTILQMLSNKMLVHDPKKRVTILYVFNALNNYQRSGK